MSVFSLSLDRDPHGNSSPASNEEYGAFHVQRGERIVFSNGRRTAYKSLQDVSGDGGTIYSAKPIPTGGMFQVKIVKRSFLFPIVSGY